MTFELNKKIEISKGDCAHLRTKHKVSVVLQRESFSMVVAEPSKSGRKAKIKIKHRNKRRVMATSFILKSNKQSFHPDRGLKISDLSQRYLDFLQCQHEVKLLGKTQTPIENRLNRTVNIVSPLVKRDRLPGVQPASLDYLLDREPERYQDKKDEFVCL